MILFFDIPSGLACLQAYLKMNNIPVKVYNFRAEEYTLPKIVKDPLIQLSPPNFIMNHQDLPLLLPLIENGFSDLEVSQYVKNNVIPEIQNNCDIIGFSLDYQNIVETTIASLFLKIEIIFFQYPGLN